MRTPNGAVVQTSVMFIGLQVLKTIATMIHPGLKDELAL